MTPRILRNVMISAVVATAAISSSCRDEGDGDFDSMYATYRNIVTFVGNNGPNFVTEYSEINDSPVITLTAAGNIDPSYVAPGTRLILTYTLPPQRVYGESGFVNLTGASLAYTAKAEILPADEIPALQPIYINTLYRSQSFINLSCSMPQVAGRQFLIYADQETVGTDTVHLYISTAIPQGSPQAHDATYIASFNIDTFWNNDNVSTVVIHTNNSNNIYQSTFTFTK